MSLSVLTVATIFQSTDIACPLFDPVLGICLIPLNGWVDDENVVKMFAVFFFSQAKVSFSTACGANECSCMWFFDVACHSFFI